MFFDTASKKHRKLQVGGVDTGWVGGRGAAYITFGYHRRPPARTRAAWPAPLSESARSYSSGLQLSGLQNGLLATAKQHATEALGQRLLVPNVAF